MRCVTVAVAELAEIAAADAFQAKQLARVALLLRGGCPMDDADEDGVTGLLRLCKGGTGLGVVKELGLVKALLAMGAACDAADGEGNVALHYAARAGNAPLVQLLCAEGGAGADARNAHGSTPLLVAASQGHLDVVSELLAHGADVDLADAHCNTPLHIACEYGWCRVAEILIAGGADVNAKNELQWEARACSWGATAALF